MAQADPQPSTPIAVLARMRETLFRELDDTPVDDQASIDLICDELASLAAQMAELPTLSLADARAKLEAVAECYDGVLETGVDGRLFDQVLAFLKVAA